MAKDILLITFTSKDFRFTRKGNVVYAIALGWPEDGRLAVRALKEGGALGEIRQVELLGHDGTLAYTRDGQALYVTLPETKPCEHAYVLKIS